MIRPHLVAGVLLGLGAATAHAGKDVLVQPPSIGLPQRGSIAGSLSRLAFGAADLARGAYSLPLPIAVPDERGPLLADVVPSYSAEHGISEWGMGWQSDLTIRRHRVIGEIDFGPGDGFTSPWGVLAKGDDGAYYPDGLRHVLRVVPTEGGWVATTGDGTRYYFDAADAVTTASGTYAWMLSRVDTVLGDETRLTWTRNDSGRAFLSEVRWGGRGHGTEYRLRLTYELLATPFASYVSGQPMLLDRRVTRVSQDVAAPTDGYRERWRHDLTYVGSPTGPAFYLRTVTRTYASGDSEPPITYDYDLGIEQRATATLERAPALDAVLAAWGETAVQPDRAAVGDLEQDGLTDLERHSDMSLMHQTEAGYVLEPLPPRTGSEHPLCRPTASAFNKPRLLVRMHGDAAEPQVVVTKKVIGSKTRIVVCDRLGFKLFDQQRAGAWELGPTTRLADLDLDHKPDVVRVYPGVAEVLRNVSASPTAIDFAPGTISTLSPAVTPEVSWVLDFNGDGRADLMTRHAGGVVVWRGTGGGGFEPQGTSFPFVLASGLPVSNLSSYEFSHGDFNGDGLSDVILTQGDHVIVFSNRGASFVETSVPGLADVPWTVGFPVIADLAGTGNEQVILPDGALGYTIQLTTPSTGLLRAADDGKGSVVRFGYARVRPSPGVRHRHAVLTSLTVESSGYDPVTHTYEYGAPVSHSVGEYLVGFAEVRKRAPFLSQTVGFHHDDHVSGIVVWERDVDERQPGIERFTLRTLEPASFHSVPWQRLRSEETGWRTSDGSAQVAGRTDYLSYERDLCAVVTEAHGPHGVLREETVLTSAAALDPELSCLPRVRRTTGTHADPQLDFTEELAIERDDLGRVVRAWQVSPAGSLLLQEVTYDGTGRIATLATPGRGTTTFGYDARTGQLISITAPDGVVERVAAHDPITDAIVHARTERGAAAFSNFFAFDGLERLAAAWDDQSGADAAHPLRAIDYVYATATTPGMIRERHLVDRAADSAAEVVELMTADGATLAKAARHAGGWAPSRVAVTERATGETRVFARDSLPTLDELTHASLLAGATLLGVSTTTGAGEALSSWTTIQEDVIQRRAVTRAILGGKLVVETTVNSAFTTRTGSGADGKPLWFQDPSGVVTAYEYDASGRLRRVHTPDGTHRLELDALGRPAAVERDGVSRVEWSYDATTGLMTERRDLSTAGVLDRTTRYEHDAIGRVIRTIETQAATGATRMVETRWDGEVGGGVILAGQLGFATTFASGEIVKATKRRADGKPTLARWQLGGWRAVVQETDYYAGGQEQRVVTRIEDGAGAVLTEITKEYAYDAYGQLASFRVNGVEVFSTSYDAQGRLAAVQVPDGDLSFQFDPTTRDRRGYAAPSGAMSWERDARGLVASERFEVGGQVRQRAYGYDARGYLVSASDESGTAQYAYDASGLIELAKDERGDRAIVRTEGAITAGGEAYQVDAMGRVVAHGDLLVEYGPSGDLERARRGADELRFVYDETGQRVLKYKNGVPIAAYVAGGYLTAAGIVEPVNAGGMLVGVLENGAFRRLAFDPRGTVITDETGALAVATPYGARTAWGPLAEAIDYVEKGYDHDLGLVRMGVRDYDPLLGQFWTPDPLFLTNLDKCAASPAECNLYGYAKNNPLSFVDPTGTEGVQVGWRKVQVGGREIEVPDYRWLPTRRDGRDPGSSWTDVDTHYTVLTAADGVLQALTLGAELGEAAWAGAAASASFWVSAVGILYTAFEAEHSLRKDQDARANKEAYSLGFVAAIFAENRKAAYQSMSMDVRGTKTHRYYATRFNQHLKEGIDAAYYLMKHDRDRFMSTVKDLVAELAKQGKKYPSDDPTNAQLMYDAAQVMQSQYEWR